MKYMKFKVRATREHAVIHFEVVGDYTSLCAVHAGMIQAGWKLNVYETLYDIVSDQNCA